MSDDKDVCPACEQEILDRCAVCRQFITEQPDPEDCCDRCGQELPDQEEEDDEPDLKGYSFRKRRDHSEQAICKWCARPMPSCPQCQRDFDSDDDDEYEHRRSKKRRRQDESEEDEEDSEEESHKGKWWGRGPRPNNLL